MKLGSELTDQGGAFRSLDRRPALSRGVKGFLFQLGSWSGSRGGRASGKALVGA